MYEVEIQNGSIKQELRELEEQEYEGEFDDHDSHCCSQYADEFGYCQYCGDVVFGSWAYEDLYGGE